MTNKKSTKRALLVSVMAMVICFTMLLGTTFAWFTDNETVTDNVIAAGTLKVGIEGSAINLTDVEPGFVYVHNLTIKNTGSLSFNYKLNLVTEGGATLGDLAEVIEVYYFLGATTPSRSNLNGAGSAGYLGTLNNVVGGDFFGAEYINYGEADDTITLVFKMQTTAGNEYQGTDLGANGFVVQVLAAQRTTETDSLGDGSYDNGATYEDGTPSNP